MHQCSMECNGLFYLCTGYFVLLRHYQHGQLCQPGGLVSHRSQRTGGWATFLYTNRKQEWVCLHIYAGLWKWLTDYIGIGADDLQHMSAVRLDAHTEFAKENDMASFLMSAKNGDQVNQAFWKIASYLSGIFLFLFCVCFNALLATLAIQSELFTPIIHVHQQLLKFLYCGRRAFNQRRHR